MSADPVVLLSFDVEEFDMPLEYGQQVLPAQQMQTGYEGYLVMMELLEQTNVPATLFTTANFADNYSHDISQLPKQHELASHTYYHASFKNEDLLRSRERLESISGRTVTGLRMPRMRKVEMAAVKAAGYQYDSSVHPTWIPGRYNNLTLPRNAYKDEGMLRLPASVSPLLRLPLFWLAFKNYPYRFFLHLTRRTLQRDGYVCLYFHPWELVDLSGYRIPGYTKKYAGKALQQRLLRLINDLKPECAFSTIEQYLQAQNLLPQS